MDTGWIQTAISLSALAMIFFYLRTSGTSLKNDVEEKMAAAKKRISSVETRLSNDEREYLTKESHGLICSDNSKSLELHINRVMAKQRKDIDEKFAEIGKMLNDLRQEIRNGRK